MYDHFENDLQLKALWTVIILYKFIIIGIYSLMMYLNGLTGFFNFQLMNVVILVFCIPYLSSLIFLWIFFPLQYISHSLLHFFFSCFSLYLSFIHFSPSLPALLVANLWPNLDAICHETFFFKIFIN